MIKNPNFWLKSETIEKSYKIWLNVHLIALPYLQPAWHINSYIVTLLNDSKSIFSMNESSKRNMNNWISALYHITKACPKIISVGRNFFRGGGQKIVVGYGFGFLQLLAYLKANVS